MVRLDLQCDVTDAVMGAELFGNVHQE